MDIKKAHITINVRNLDISIAFYESIGFKLEQRWINHYAQLIAPGIEIGLHPTSESKLHGSSGNVAMGLTTDNFEETRDHLTQMNILESEREEEGGNFLHFKDPDGTSLYFIQPK